MWDQVQSFIRVCSVAPSLHARRLTEGQKSSLPPLRLFYYTTEMSDLMFFDKLGDITPVRVNV